MEQTARWLAFAVLLMLFPLMGRAPAVADDGTGAASVDAVAKQRQDEFEELQKKKTTQAAMQRLEILRGLAFAPCTTARRFLLGLVKKSSASGDERVGALQSLVHMLDESALETLLATLVQEKDPTLWQVFSESLGSARSDTLQTWRKGAGLASRDTETLAAVLDASPGGADAATLERIEALYAKHQKPPGSPELVARALRALATARGAAALPLLLEAVRHADPRVRLVPADILPSFEPFSAEVEAGVRGLLADEIASIRQTTAARTGAARRSGLVPSLIPLLADPRLRTRHVASKALEQITGQLLGHDAKAWAAWLAKQDPGKPEQLTFPSYHGFSVETDRVVFLVDASSSMTWPWRKEPHRIDVARTELASVLRQLTPQTQFNVLVYAEEQSWFRKAEVLATPENVSAALQWATKALATPAGDTRLVEALEVAFTTDPQFDTIFLLTDGNPTNGRYWTAPGLLASVRAWNRHRRAAIHTIGLSLANLDRGMPNLSEDLQVMTALLSSLAGTTSGEYREILDAPTAK
jgi:hypothetical protein